MNMHKPLTAPLLATLLMTLACASVQAQGVYRIVGPDETDATLGYISIDSPLARALLKKRVDDEIEVALPGGAESFSVMDVSYAHLV